MKRIVYGERWKKCRRLFLDDNPWCVKCRGAGLKTPADHVDHIVPHRGSYDLFWDENNWQPLCEEHHNKHKQREEGRGYDDAVGADGMPTDPRHPFYATGTGGA